LLPRAIRVLTASGTKAPKYVTISISFSRHTVLGGAGAMSASKGRVLLAYSGGLGEWEWLPISGSFRD
jgi:hypothetical protein